MRRLFPYFRADALVQAAYRGLLARDPDPDGFSGYRKSLVRNRNPEAIFAELVRSDEFWRKAMASRAADLVRSACRGLLGRNLYTARDAAYIDSFSKSRDLPAMLAEIVRSEEFRQKSLADGSTDLVAQIHSALLGREPDPEVLAEQASALSQKPDLEDFLSSFARSEEFQKKTFEAHLPEIVRCAYRGLTGTEPDPEKEEECLAALAESRDLSALFSEITASEEFFRNTLARRSTEFVRSLYEGLLARDPDPKACASYGAILEQSRDLPGIMRDILRSDEFWRKIIAKRAHDLVRALYLVFFEREPDSEAAESYSLLLEESRDLPSLISALAGSDEFFRLTMAKRAPDLFRAVHCGLFGEEPEAEAETGCPNVSEIPDLSLMVAEIVRSDEFWRKTVAQRAPEIAETLYRGLFGCEPDREAAKEHAKTLAETGDPAVLVSQLADTEEFFRKVIALKATQFVRIVYRALLRREPDPGAEEAYGSRLAETSDLHSFLIEIVRSDEFWRSMQALRAQDIVRDVYQGLLEREAEPEAEAFYSARLCETRKLSALLKDIAGSEEFKRRFVVSRAGEIAQAVWQGLFGRKPDQKTLREYTELLRESGDLASLFPAVTASGTFSQTYSSRRNRQNPAARYKAPCLVFLHIQKTAGTSVQNHLKESFRNNGFFGEHSDTLHLYSPAELSEFDILAGHFNYDSLRYIPREKLSVFTFLREPKSRLLSLYHFWRAHEPTHPSFADGIVRANQMEIEEFFEFELTRRNFGLWNNTAWAVMGERWWRKWRGAWKTGEQNVFAAIESEIRPAISKRLNEFVFIGLQEDFDRSIGHLYRILRKPPPPRIRSDHTLEQLVKDPHFKKNMQKQPPTPALESVLDRFVALDRIVYEEGRKIHLRQLSEMESNGVPEVHIESGRKAGPAKSEQICDSPTAAE